MTTWEQYVESEELASVARWVDELSDDPTNHPQDIANRVIDDGVVRVHEGMFDEIVDYVDRRRS